MLGTSTSVSFRSDGLTSELPIRRAASSSFSGATAIAQVLDPTNRRLSELLSSGSARNLGEAFQQLNPSEQYNLRERWGRSLDELISLASERDATIFHHGLLEVGHRLEDADQVELASVVYSSLVAGNSPRPPLNLRGGKGSVSASSESSPPLNLRGGQEGLLPVLAQSRLNAINGVGDWRARLAFNLERLPTNATRWDILFAMGGAGLVFRGVRLAATARWATSFESAFALNAAATSTAFLFETAAFTSFGRLFGTMAGHHYDWSAEGTFNEWAGGAAMLLGLKAMGGMFGNLSERWAAGETAFARVTRAVAPQAGMFSGIVLGNRLAELGGFHPERHGDTWLVDGLTTLLEFNIAGRLQRGAGGPGLTNLEGRMEAYTRALGSAGHPVTGMRKFFGELFSPAWVTPGGIRLANSEIREPPVDPRDFISLMMAKPEEKGSGAPSIEPASGEPASGEAPLTIRSADSPYRSTTPLTISAALGQFHRFQNPERALEALALLYLGSHGPIRPFLFDAILQVERGAELLPTVETILENPAMRESRFFSNEAQMSITYALNQLYNGEPVDLLRFILNGNGRKSSVDLAEEAMPVPNLFKPTHLGIEEQFRLYSVYLRQLSDRAKHPPEHWPLSARLAHGENFALASHFETDARGMRQIADRDNLTGVLNREGLMRITPRLEKQVLMSSRSKDAGERKHVYVLLADVDYLKRLNEQYQHTGADIVLREVAQLFSANVRIGDVVARFGGDEFLICLVDSSREGALSRAEALRNAVDLLEVPLPSGKTARVTVSIGVADMRPMPSLAKEGEFKAEGSLVAAIERASSLLIKGKLAGRRNEVFVSEE